MRKCLLNTREMQIKITDTTSPPWDQFISKGPETTSVGKDEEEKEQVTLLVVM